MEFLYSAIRALRGIGGMFLAAGKFAARLVAKFIIGIWHWLKGLASSVFGLWLALGPRWLRYTIATVAVVFAGYSGAQWALKPNLTLETIDRVRFISDGWDRSARETFYYTPQGTELLGMHYDWMVNLEMPLSKDRLASADNMRGWGFIVAPGQFATQQNPGNLPVGMTRHTDPHSGKERLDIGCALCHTGELHYKGTALRIDGGQALQGITTGTLGEFITTVGAAAFETYYNPVKWNRFADRVAGSEEADRDQLRTDFSKFLDTFKAFVGGPSAPKLSPTTEGRGRTDAVGRIGNVVFGYNLKMPENYAVADAPVNYPFLWDIWRFDWVQYTGFSNQPMSRNVGESLGVLAPVKLVDENGQLLPEGEFGQSTIDIDGLHCVETTLRSLKPPKWPEDVLGEIDLVKAREGKALFTDQCAFCHGPHISEPYNWALADGPESNPDNQLSTNWEWDMAGDVSYDANNQPVRRDWREAIWALPWIDTAVIGTDPTAADNFMDTAFNPGPLLPPDPYSESSNRVNAGDGLQLLLNKLVPVLYKNRGVSSADNGVADFDGANAPFRVANKRAYKSRPLHGVWATPPFLHNGSVPTIYDLLSPLEARPTEFAVGNREYDPVKLGYITDKLPGSFVHDTKQKGNSNRGHLFTDIEMPGRIGDLLSEKQRMAILEYLKIMGNPEFAEAIGGDPMNWAQYSEPPSNAGGLKACGKQPPTHSTIYANNYSNNTVSEGAAQ